ncbi:MAG TPA: hypothetical protein VGO29_05845 [Solirubrobacteraceae bacterium]|jgi:hypothetical protein|nr:hypothetical protein [Solirubrobacteraceae bacterium]
MRQQQKGNKKMRHTIKAALGALLALLALSALATTVSASAATCQKEGREAEHKTLCVEGKQVGSPTKAAHTFAKWALKPGTSAVISVPEWSVTCTSVKAAQEPEIESGGEWAVRLTGLQLKFSECAVAPSSFKCKVPLPFSTYQLAGSLVPTGAFLLGSGRSNQEFLEFEINGCVLSGIYWVYGTQECAFKQAEVEAVTKELACETSGSKLELRHGQGGAVRLALTGNVELTGESKGKKYSITK